VAKPLLEDGHRKEGNMPSEYSQKLKDPRWQKKRLEILERDEWTCQICYDFESTLVVHHRKYLPNTDPWDYPDHLLVTLCENCHEAERIERPESEKYLLEALRKQFFTRDILSFTQGFNKLELLHVPEVVASVYEWALASPEIQRELIDRFFLETKAKLRANRNNNAER